MWSAGLYTPSISAADATLSTSGLRQKVYSDIYKTFDAALADGRATPFLLPASLTGPAFITFLWLVIPHTRRPWLYSMRWLVATVVLVLNLDMIRRTRSPHAAIGYGIGLASALGVLLALNFIIFTRPQFDAARIVRRPKSPVLHRPAQDDKAVLKNQLRAPDTSQPTPQVAHKIESSVNQEVEYVWEPYPENGPFSARAYWVTALLCNFRGIGWNWWTTSLPHPEIPKVIHPGMPVDTKAIPIVSRSGYRRPATEREFIRSRLLRLALSYVFLDLLGLYAAMDPYFTLGHSTEHLALPSHLESAPFWFLFTYRNLFTITVIYFGMAGGTALNDFFFYYLVRRISPIYGELWMYTDTNGPFLSSVLDHGLAGFWGRWWHQTFRVFFASPSKYLLHHGYIARDTVLGTTVTMFMAFFQSGFLHASGSYTHIARTEPWRPMAFFLLQGVGIIVQKSVAAVASKVVPSNYRLLSQIANMLFVMAWLNVTGKLLADDLAAGGVWFMETTIFSFARALGLGYPDDHWLRADTRGFFKFRREGQWWQHGLSF